MHIPAETHVAFWRFMLNQLERERRTQAKTPKQKHSKLQAPQGGRWGREKVVPGVALLHHHDLDHLGLAGLHKRHHDLIGEQLPASAVEQQLLNASTFALSYSTQVLIGTNLPRITIILKTQ